MRNNRTWVVLSLMSGTTRVGGYSLVWGLLLAACSSSEDGGSPNAAPGASGASSTNTESCVEDALFPAEAHGDDGADLIRAIQLDEAAGQLIFSDLGELFEVPLEGGKPSLLGPRPNDAINGDFWLQSERLLFPAGFATPLIEAQQAVLFSTDRSLETVQVLVGIPAPPSLEWEYQIRDVRVVGDDVYWLARDSHTDRPADLLPDWDSTYALRRTSWRNPAEPEELYSTKVELDDLVVAGKLAFVREIDPDTFQRRQQRIVDLTSNTLLDDDAEAKFGGVVVAGDEASLFVTKLQLEAPNEIGVFRIAPDGSDQTMLTANPFVSDFRSNGDTWFFTDGQALGDPTLVFSYRVGGAARQIGCIESSATVHALASSDSKVYAGVYSDQKTTVLQFDR